MRFTGHWAQGGAVRQLVRVLAHGLVPPHTRYAAPSPSNEPVPAPARDPRWATKHSTPPNPESSEPS